MKRIIFLLAFAGLLIPFSASPSNLRAYLSYSTFYSLEHGPYLETYLSVLGKSVVFVKKDNGKFQGTVLVTMLFKQNDSIRDFRKYELHSPEADDTTSINFSFLDQQRIPLPNGTYDFDLTIADKNQDRPPFHVTENLMIGYPSDKVNVSGIELVESFKKSEAASPLSKSGFEFIPFMDNFYPPSVSKLTYYAEIYNTSKLVGPEEKFAVLVSLQSFETNKIVAEFQKVKRESPKPVVVSFGEFDISQLPSGNYNLVISVRDRNNNELAGNQLFLQRSNPSVQYNLDQLSRLDISNSFALYFTSLDTLREYVRSLFPIASASEKLFIKTYTGTADLDVLQRFFFTFWTNRDPLNPVAAWNTYLEQVMIVDKEFRCANHKGFESDRGRIYLQFGPPNHRVEEDKDPTMYPYEIWQYYKAGGQTDRRFVFCTHDITANCYELIHSDVNGEVYNPWWQSLTRKGARGQLGDRENDYLRRPSEDEDGYWGGHSSDYYNNPR